MLSVRHVACTGVLLLQWFQIGDVLIGNKRSRTFEFVNTGGDGCFLLLTAQQWAAALQQTGQDSNKALSEAAGSAAGQSLESGSSSGSSSPAHAAAVQVPAADVLGFDDEAPAAVNSGPFSISPAYLDLPAGAAAVLAVEFSPQQQGLQSADFMLVCDNCTAHPLRVEGYGEQVQVQLVGLDDREWLQQDGQMPLWFGQVRPKMGAVNVFLHHTAVGPLLCLVHADSVRCPLTQSAMLPTDSVRDGRQYVLPTRAVCTLMRRCALVPTAPGG